jgi:hypothetical protein
MACGGVYYVGETTDYVRAMRIVQPYQYETHEEWMGAVMLWELWKDAK